MKIKLTYSLFALLVVFACKQKQEPQVNSFSEKPDTSAKQAFAIDATKDAEYLVDTYSNGLFALKVAELVEEKSSNNVLKAFAGKIADTHYKIVNEVKSLAHTKKITLPSGLNLIQLNELNKISETQSGQLEKLFIEKMEVKHREDIELLEKISKESEDNEIATLAIASLATVKSQYDEVIAVKERLDM